MKSSAAHNRACLSADPGPDSKPGTYANSSEGVGDDDKRVRGYPASPQTNFRRTAPATSPGRKTCFILTL